MDDEGLQALAYQEELLLMEYEELLEYQKEINLERIVDYV